jgi:hypothetical protein
MGADIVLDRDEEVAGRPFTDPAHTADDERALRQLLHYERTRARAWASDPTMQANTIIRERDRNGLRHLLVVPDPQALLEAQSPTVVGFFGRPRADADVPLLFELEEELVAGMGEAEELLSYYDVELVKGAYGNLILFASPEGPRKWRQNAVHSRAVEISPVNYHEIRLHQGSLSGPFLADGALRLTRTRYIDYSDGTPWYAVRERPF